MDSDDSAAEDAGGPRAKRPRRGADAQCEYTMSMRAVGSCVPGSAGCPLTMRSWSMFALLSGKLPLADDNTVHVPCTLTIATGPRVPLQGRVLAVQPLLWDVRAPGTEALLASEGSVHDGLLWSVLRARREPDVCVEVPLSAEQRRCAELDFHGPQTGAPPSPWTEPDTLHVCCHSQVLRTHSAVLGALMDVCQGRPVHDATDRCPVPPRDPRRGARAPGAVLRLGSEGVVGWRVGGALDAAVERWRPAAVYAALSVLYALSTPCGHVLLAAQPDRLALWCQTAAVLHEWRCGGAFQHVLQLCTHTLNTLRMDVPQSVQHLRQCAEALPVLAQPAFEHTALCEQLWHTLLDAPMNVVTQTPPSADATWPTVAPLLATSVDAAAYAAWCVRVHGGGHDHDAAPRYASSGRGGPWRPRGGVLVAHNLPLYRYFWLGAVMWLYASGAAPATLRQRRCSANRRPDDTQTDDERSRLSTFSEATAGGGGGGAEEDAEEAEEQVVLSATDKERATNVQRALRVLLHDVAHPIEFVHVATTHLVDDLRAPHGGTTAGFGTTAQAPWSGTRRRRLVPPWPLFAPLHGGDGLDAAHVADALHHLAAALTTQLIAENRHHWALPPGEP